MADELHEFVRAEVLTDSNGEPHCFLAPRRRDNTCDPELTQVMRDAQDKYVARKRPSAEPRT